jgi:multiple antibiotic resistance protein
MSWTFDDLLTVTFSLFAIIDIIGSIPLLISMKEKLGGFNEIRITVLSGLLMILFVFIGQEFLKIFGLDIGSFAVGGSIVIFILGLEMVLGVEFFKPDADPRSGTLVPIAFPLIAGSGTLTTIISLRANYDTVPLLIGIVINLVVVYVVLRSLKYIARLLGPGGLIGIRKFFGVVLLAIAVKIFTSNVGGLIKS